MSAGGTNVPSTPEERRLVFEQFLRCIDREENLIHYRMSWGLQCNLAFFAGIIALQQLDLKIQLGSYNLGPVDKPDPEPNAPEQDETEEAGCGLVIPGGDTALFLEMTNEAFDA